MMWFFFFSSRRRHTRLQGDWSSDVCSSDLRPSRPTARRSHVRTARALAPREQARGPRLQASAKRFFGRRFSRARGRSEEHTSELQSPCNLVCRLLLEKKKIESHTTAYLTS